MYDCVAGDAAVEDALYYMDRALHQNVIDLETHLKVNCCKQALCTSLSTTGMPILMEAYMANSYISFFLSFSTQHNTVMPLFR